MTAHVHVVPPGVNQCVVCGAKALPAAPRPILVDYGPSPDREPIAIGDTFLRVGDPGGAWEVTRQDEGIWILERGPHLIAATSRQLLDRALYVPAAAL